MTAIEASMLEVELELAYREADRHVLVETANGTFYARLINAGSFMVLAIPFDEPAAVPAIGQGISSLRLVERSAVVA